MVLDRAVEKDVSKDLKSSIVAVIGDSIQSELRPLEKSFSRGRLNLERAWDFGSSRCPITATIRNFSIEETSFSFLAHQSSKIGQKVRKITKCFKKVLKIA